MARKPKQVTKPNRDKSRERRCIVSGECREEADLIRFVVGPEDQVVPDLGAKLPGRGMWVSATRENVALALNKGLFSRAAKAKVTASDDLADQIEAQLLKRISNGLGLAAKAGALTTGFEKVREGLKSGVFSVLLEASDGSADGRDKIFALAHGLGKKVLVLGCLTAEEMSLALGRTNVIHAALSTGSLARRLEIDVHRLKGFRPLAPADWRLPGASEDKSLSNNAAR